MTVTEKHPADHQVERFSSPLRRRSSARILLIEDHAELRDALAEHLEKNGYSVLPADDGTIGLAEFLRDQPDLVILDLQISGMDGLRVLGEIRGRSPDVPVILMTTKIAPVYSAIQSVTVLRKPFLPDWLLRDVRAALSGKQGRRVSGRAPRRL